MPLHVLRRLNDPTEYHVSFNRLQIGAGDANNVCAIVEGY
jgi:hypothetical protein